VVIKSHHKKGPVIQTGSFCSINKSTSPPRFARPPGNGAHSKQFVLHPPQTSGGTPDNRLRQGATPYFGVARDQCIDRQRDCSNCWQDPRSCMHQSWPDDKARYQRKRGCPYWHNLLPGHTGFTWKMGEPDPHGCSSLRFWRSSIAFLIRCFAAAARISTKPC